MIYSHGSAPGFRPPPEWTEGELFKARLYGTCRHCAMPREVKPAVDASAFMTMLCTNQECPASVA